MDKFRKKFLEEANEHISNIEEALLKLEESSGKSELIEQIFRSMHTLKGGGAMFGFNRISELTHSLETIFDHLRKDISRLSEDIIAISFEAVDQLKILADENRDSEIYDSAGYRELLNKIEQCSNLTSTATDVPEKASKKYPDKEHRSTTRTFYIYFKPHADIFDNGTNPLYIIDELVSDESYISLPRFGIIPELGHIEPEKCYIWWEIFLATDKSLNELKDIFIFVEDACELEVIEIAPVNLIDNNRFFNEVRTYIESGERTDLSFIRSFTTTARDNQKKEEPDAGKSILSQKIKEAKISSIRVDSEKIDNFMNLVSELITTQATLSLFATKEQNHELSQIAENMQKLTRDLRDLAFNIALIPIDQVVTRFHRLVRDLSKELCKEVDFITEGTETELDKNIIECLSDPILHILRNSVDHGIESPEKRRQLGKPEKGHIHFKAFYAGANVHIQINDDGAGMDPERIREKAIENKIINTDSEMSRREIFDLIFLPGFSTSQNVTGISGRGVGMDVVKRRISEIRGTVEIDSEINVGTTITIKIPLTLSIIDGLLVNVDKEKYLIPLTSIRKIYPIHHRELVNNFHNLIRLDDRLIPYFYLRDEFNINENISEEEHAVEIGYEDKKVALIVDNVIGEYQAVLKTLGRHYKNQDMICGATILGDGAVALVMDTNAMVNSFVYDRTSNIRNDLVSEQSDIQTE